jgi:threonine/homoserine/homoserine lactone efflux protein
MLKLLQRFFVGLIGLDMNTLFLIKCFFLGFSAASAVGPIFVLTFNRGALYGFLKGFATAFGAAIGDGFLFGLGLCGILNFLEESRRCAMAMDIIGGISLVIMGIRMFEGKQKLITDVPFNGFIYTMSKSLLLTVINPITVFFFMFMGFNLFPDGLCVISFLNIFLGCAMVSCGSLTLLSIVALIASRVRNVLSVRRLVTISHITGVIFVILGLYFFVNFILKLIIK